MGTTLMDMVLSIFVAKVFFLVLFFIIYDTFISFLRFSHIMTFVKIKTQNMSKEFAYTFLSFKTIKLKYDGLEGSDLMKLFFKPLLISANN